VPSTAIPKERESKMSDFAYNHNSYFTSSTPVDGGPTAWGIYEVAAGALHSSDQNNTKLDELKLLVTDLGKAVADLRSEIGTIQSELNHLKRAVLTVRIRQEKSLLPLGSRTLAIASIVAGRVAADELAKLGTARPNFRIPIKNDPFAGAPELV
jgi:hypothetical protein